MKKAGAHVLGVLEKILFLGFSVQIILGLLWMWGAFFTPQQFGDSTLYLEASKNFRLDEYTGFLYPVILFVSRSLEQIFGIPYYAVIYVLQLGVGYWAGQKILQKFGEWKGWKKVWGSMVILTFPMILQCHMALLPLSLASSCLLLELSAVIQGIRKKEAFFLKDFAVVLSFWILAAMFSYDFLFLGLLPVLFSILYFWILRKRDRKKWIGGCLLFAAALGIFLGCNHLFFTEAASGKSERSVSLVFMKRMAGTHIGDTYNYWPEELKDCMDDEKIEQCILDVENIDRILAPALIKEVGTKRANEIFQTVGVAAWQVYNPAVRREILLDGVAYAFAPAVFHLQMKDRAYASFSSRNYDIMRMAYPIWTGYFMNYGTLLFGFFLALSGIQQVLLWIFLWVKKKEWKKTMVSAFLCALSALGFIIWYTMQGSGCMDYKNVLVVIALWLVWMLSVREAASAFEKKREDYFPNQEVKQKEKAL